MEGKDIYSPPEANLEVAVESSLASRWARLGASVVDVIIAMIIMGPIAYYSGYWDRAVAETISYAETIAWVLLGLVFYFVVNGYLLAKQGQTIGKRVVGIRIVSVDTNEIIPLWKVMFVRYIPQVVVANIPMVGQFLIMIDYLFIFRKDKRCIHDLIASTKVIKANAH